MTDQNTTSKNGKEIYHLNIKLRRDPLVITPVDEKGIPIGIVGNVSLIYLCDSSGDKRTYQFNYIGKDKPLSLQLIEDQIAKERQSHAYRDLEEVVESFKATLYEREPIEIIENAEPLVFFNQDETGQTDFRRFSLVHFGKKYPISHKSSRPVLKIKYAGPMIVQQYKEALTLPENYCQPIVDVCGRIDESLKRRYEEEYSRKIKKKQQI